MTDTIVIADLPSSRPPLAGRIEHNASGLTQTKGKHPTKDGPNEGRMWGCRRGAGRHDGGRLSRREALLRCVRNRRVQTYERSLGIAELRRPIAPGHDLRLMHHDDLAFQPRKLRVDIIDHEFDDGGAIGAGFSADRKS